MVSSEDSVDGQSIIVEIMDEWTHSLTDTIVKHKAAYGKCNIVPVAAARVLGHIFSQFSIMPDLNQVYGRLFSNKGATFYTDRSDDPELSESAFITEFLKDHKKAIPLTVKRGENGEINRYYMADLEKDVCTREAVPWRNDIRVSVNPHYEIKDRHIVILGHNSKIANIMEGLGSFNAEWRKKDGSDVLDVTIIDNESNLAAMDRYEGYPFVKNVIPAEVFDKDIICNMLEDFIRTRREGGCILILSDDTVPDDDVDADVLTYLILVQEIFNKVQSEDPSFSVDGIDMVVEILNPQNYDLMNQYSTKNIVISNRYLSKMIMQIGEHDLLFSFFEEILTFDDPDSGEDSKEVYIKRADEFLLEMPPPCTAADLIRAIYRDSPDDNKSLILGYFDKDGEMTMFKGDQMSIRIELTGKERLILYSNH
jgi:hypothetical protein